MQRCGDVGGGESQVGPRWPWEWDGRGRQWCPKAFHVYNICQVRKREIPLIHTKSINSHQTGILYFPRVVLAGNAWQRRRQRLGFKLLWFDIWSIRIRTCMILFRAIDKGVKARLFTLLPHANACAIKQSDCLSVEWTTFLEGIIIHHSCEPTVSIFQKSDVRTLYWYLVVIHSNFF